ncbi:MAG: hypothetical protein FH749_13040 [Firmicutes bacterium]|nr:hypothetical protein [Bacillota bacterium]
MEQKTVWPGVLKGHKIPAPTEVACIYVKKIYDACSQRECVEFFFDDLELPQVPLEELEVECTIVPGSESFSDWSIEPIDGGPLGLVRVTVCATVEIIIRDSNNPNVYTTNYEEVCFFKEVVLYAPDPVNMQVLVESIFEALACSSQVNDESLFTVTATIGAFIIVKTGLEVQLLVPAYGFCPVPPECEELGDLCEQFLQRPFPPFFPPQLNDLNNG